MKGDYYFEKNIRNFNDNLRILVNGFYNVSICNRNRKKQGFGSI